MATQIHYRCVSYPHFEPDHTWLRQILLFVDEVYRIVPEEAPLDDSDQLKRLMEACDGSILTISPKSYVEVSEPYARAFGQALDQPEFLNIAATEYGKEQVKDWELLHPKKVGPHIESELLSRRMQRMAPNKPDWVIVPRGVGGLALSLLASNIAETEGFDAITDQPLAYAMNGLFQCRGEEGSAQIEGVIASAIATIHVPKGIVKLPVKDYAELRKNFSDARYEYATMVRELKSGARLDRIKDPKDFRRRLDEITEGVGADVEKYRKSKAATKVNEWLPMTLTTLFPATIAFFAGGPLPALGIAAFSFTVNAIGKATKKTPHFRYPKVLQTLSSVRDATGEAAIKTLLKE